MAQQLDNLGLFGRALVGALALGCGGRAPSEAAPPNTEGGSLIGGQAAGNDFARSAADTDDTRAEPLVAPGMPEPSQLPPRTGGSVRLQSSGLGLERSVYVVTSPLGTTLELVEAGERICVRGELAPVPDGDYPNYWGGEVGVALVANVMEIPSQAEALRTSGFAFRLQGTLPPIVRFRVGAAAEVPYYSQYCDHVGLETGARIEVPLDALTYECWNIGGAAFPMASGAALISWQVPASPETAGPFDFCIEAIDAL